jgi:hypothetical protein
MSAQFAAAAFDPDQPASAELTSHWLRKPGASAMSDFCYSRPMLKRVFRQAELMDRMMERVGVDLAKAARLDRGAAWYEARTRCIACCCERQCLNWLEHSQAQAPAEPPEFCHNTEFFRSCRRVAGG